MDVVRVDFTRSRTPVIRAGWGNLYPILALWFGFLVNAPESDLGSVQRLALTVLLCGFWAWLYVTTASSVVLSNESLDVELPLWKIRYPLSKVSKVSVRSYWVKSFCLMIIRVHQSRWGRRFFLPTWQDQRERVLKELEPALRACTEAGSIRWRR